MVKVFTTKEFDSDLLNKFHTLSPEHQTMVMGMINGFYMEDIKKAPSVDGEGDSATQKGTPSLK